MKSLTITITEKSYRLLSQEAHVQGLSVAVLVRRIIYEHQKVEKELMKKTVTQLKESIAKVATLPKTKNKKRE